MLPRRWVRRTGEPLSRVDLTSIRVTPRSFCLSDSGRICAFGAGRAGLSRGAVVEKGMIAAAVRVFQMLVVGLFGLAIAGGLWETFGKNYRTGCDNSFGVADVLLIIASHQTDNSGLKQRP